MPGPLLLIFKLSSMTKTQLLQLEKAVAKTRGRYEALSEQFYQLRQAVYQASDDWHKAVNARKKALEAAKAAAPRRIRSRKVAQP